METIIMATPFVSPNLYQLSGNNLHINYSTSGIDGKPHFNYQDAQQNLSFIGDDVRAVECDLGTVVSVTIQRTIDSGSTSFSVLIPRINLAAGESVRIRTKGIVTIHRFSIIPAANHGQLDLYTVTKLRGTASEVAF
jgi:hypothetical protein